MEPRSLVTWELHPRLQRSEHGPMTASSRAQKLGVIRGTLAGQQVHAVPRALPASLLPNAKTPNETAHCRTTGTAVSIIDDASGEDLSRGVARGTPALDCGRRSVRHRCLGLVGPEQALCFGVWIRPGLGRLPCGWNRNGLAVPPCRGAATTAGTAPQRTTREHKWQPQQRTFTPAATAMTPQWRRVCTELHGAPS